MPWIVAKIKPNQDKIALQNLERQNFIFFQPKFETTAKIKNKFKVTIKPVFPGYIFINVNYKNSDWHKINNTRGLSAIIAFGNKIPIIPNELIKDLKDRFILNTKLQNPYVFKKGMHVEITNGPFSTILGNIDEINADKRIWILLDILGKQTRVSVDEQHLIIRH